MAKFDVVDDAEFTAFVNKVQEEQNEQNNRSSGGNSNYTPEDIKWVGLPEKKMEIVRLLGKPPRGTEPGMYDMHEIFSSELKDDDGKIMKLVLPVREDIREKDHIMWRIIDSVMRVTWIKDPTNKEGKSTKVYENEFKYPEIFNKVAKSGFDPKLDENKYKWTRGWAGQRVLIANAIVRSCMDWHKTNKHTVLLSKNVNKSDDGTKEYPFTGIASYGFVEGLSAITLKYGSLEKYDLGITRTGVMNNPYKIINASKMIEKEMFEEVDASVQKLVVVGPLTEDELNYDRYEIGRLFKPTSYSKLKRRLGKTVKAIDGALRTNYYDELTKLAEIETEENKAKAEATASTEAAPAQATVSQVTESVVKTEPAATKVEAPVRTRATAPAVAAQATDDRYANVLKGWSSLTEEQKTKILDVEVSETGTVTQILYVDDPNDFQVGCPDCGLGAPQSFTVCPNCNKLF